MLTSSFISGENKNKVLGTIAVVALLAAGGIYYFSSAGAGEAAPAIPADRMIKVACSNCEASWEMSFGEYERRKNERSNDLEKLVCDKCGQKTLWKVGGLDMSNLPKVPEDMKANAWDSKAEENPDAAGATDKPKVKKPAAAPMLNPNNPK